jgi:hypothetical protein
MPDSTRNADGTKQVSPPTQSAFAKDTADLKSAPPPPDTSAKAGADHETSIVEGIKGLIRQHSGGTANKAQDTALAALDKGVSDAPGNSSDY